MEIKYRLIAETLRYWRANSEERALGEYVLLLTGLNREFIDAHTVQEIMDELINFTGRTEIKIQESQQSKDQQELQQELDQSQEEESVEALETPVNKFANLPKKGRPRKD